jgi:serine/threonine protein kinase
VVLRSISLAGAEPDPAELDPAHLDSAHLDPAHLDNLMGLAELWHPNLVKLFQVGRSASEELVVVTEHVEGRSLQQIDRLFRQQGQTTPHWLVLWLVGIACQTLQHLHDRGLYHGGVDSHRLMLADRGWVKLRDAGLAPIARHAPAVDPTHQQQRDRLAVERILDQLVRGPGSSTALLVRELFDGPELSLGALGERLFGAARALADGATPGGTRIPFDEAVAPHWPVRSDSGPSLTPGPFTSST